MPSLTTGNEATESLTDCEAVERTMEILTKTTSKFREAEMRRKLKEFQGLRTQAYQHVGDYIEGDKVWYQPLNGNSWLGPAAVLCREDKVSGSLLMEILGKLQPVKLNPMNLLIETLKNIRNK